MLMVTTICCSRSNCVRSIVLADGRVQYDGSTRELLADSELLSRFRLELILRVILDATDG